MMMTTTATIALSCLLCLAPQDEGPRQAPPTAEQARVAKSMGEQLFAAKKYQASLKRWDIVVRFKQSNPVPWYFRAACHAGLGDTAQALTNINQALTLLPDWPKALGMRAELHLLAGDFAATIADQRRAIALEQEIGKKPHPRSLAVIEQATRMREALTKLTLGEDAPEVRLRDAERKSIRVSDLRDAKAGHALVIVFHSGFGSPHSRAELSRVREFQKQIVSCKARVVAVSRSNPTENKILAEDKGLTFPLLSDVDGATIETYGFVNVLRPGKPAGTLLGIVVIDAAGKLRHREAYLDAGRSIDFKAFIKTLSTITGVKPPSEDEDGDDGDDR
jgi:peroxiredoxin